MLSLSIFFANLFNINNPASSNNSRGAKNVTWPWIHLLRRWGSLAMAIIGKCVYIEREGGAREGPTVLHTCSCSLSNISK